MCQKMQDLKKGTNMWIIIWEIDIHESGYRLHNAEIACASTCALNYSDIPEAVHIHKHTNGDVSIHLRFPLPHGVGAVFVLHFVFNSSLNLENIRYIVRELYNRGPSPIAFNKSSNIS